MCRYISHSEIVCRGPKKFENPWPKRFVSAMLFLLIVGKRNYEIFYLPKKHDFARNFVNIGAFLQSLLWEYSQRNTDGLSNTISCVLGRKIRWSRLKYVWYKYDACMMQIWCKYDANMIPVWCKYEASLVQVWCKYDAIMIQVWCKYDESMVQV
jgi:hypothetical protein